MVQRPPTVIRNYRDLQFHQLEVQPTHHHEESTITSFLPNTDNPLIRNYGGHQFQQLTVQPTIQPPPPTSNWTKQPPVY